MAGVEVDVGAESMLARRPEAVGLAAELGIEVVHPAPGSTQLGPAGPCDRSRAPCSAYHWTSADLAASGVLSDDGLARATHETALPLADHDVSVGELLGSRLGPEVVDRLAEPLLGGVYAGHASNLSAARGRPPGRRAVREHGSLLGGRGRRATGVADDSGVRRCRGRGRTAAERLAAGARVRTSAPVRGSCGRRPASG